MTPADTEAVGFFANRNHFAALVYALMLFAAAWTSNAAVAAGVGRNWKQYDVASIVTAIGCFTLIVLLLAGEAMARSRAGLGLTIVALFGAFALAFSDRRAGTGAYAQQSCWLAQSRLQSYSSLSLPFTAYWRDLQSTPSKIADYHSFAHTIQAAKAYMPLGSGLGTFVPVYALFEQPGDTAINSYVNRAHNDVLELWLETGVLGLVLMGLFAIWLAARSVKFWRSAPLGAREIDWSLARAATIIIVLVIIHSLVDYPLRTGAMMAIMAFVCALLIEPPVGAEDVLEPQALRKRTRHRGVRRLEPSPSPALSRRSSRATRVGRPPGSSLARDWWTVGRGYSMARRVAQAVRARLERPSSSEVSPLALWLSGEGFAVMTGEFKRNQEFCTIDDARL